MSEPQEATVRIWLSHGKVAGVYALCAAQVALSREERAQLGGVHYRTQPTYRIITPDRTHTAGGCATFEKVKTIGRSKAKSSVLASHLLDRAPLMRPKRQAPRGTLELFAQLVAAQTGVSEDAVQRPALEFAMQRHNKGDGPILVLETNMAAALAGYFPAELLEHID